MPYCDSGDVGLDVLGSGGVAAQRKMGQGLQRPDAAHPVKLLLIAAVVGGGGDLKIKKLTVQ